MQSAPTLVIGFVGVALWGMAIVAGARSVGTAEEASSDFDPSTMETIEITDIPQTTEPEVSPEEPALPASTDEAGEAQPANRTGTDAEEMEPTETIVAQAQQPAPAQVEPSDGSGEGIALPRPQTSGAGLLTFDDRTLKLADIEATDPARTCIGAGGTEWPCGMLARTQQRLFIRNRTVTCDIDSAEWQGTREARCRLGEIDLSAWLAENGWVETPEGSPLRPLTEKARSEHRGLFGGDPR